jgi:hypothetical protein
VQVEREDHEEEHNRNHHCTDSPHGRPAVRRPTTDVQLARCKGTKYPGKTVLHDFARSDDDLRRT